jgi:murein DD-endopeptidase MepM/ murein hydrolase activator NlpD
LKGKALQDQVAMFLSLAVAIAVGLSVVFVRNFDSLDEQSLKQENLALKMQWQIVEDRIHHAFGVVNGLIEKDDNNYRVILDSEPLSPEIRLGGVGGSEKFNTEEVRAFPTLLYDYTILEKLKSTLDIEVQSYDQLLQLLDDRINMWASRPAIQPINNKQLDQLHMSYGTRMHPIFKVPLPHNGLDFSASKGTPVYATGDGEVTKVYFSKSYGNVIYIEHGHGYETRYAHLSSFAVNPGEKVKRGHTVGYVGTTGNSVNYHLHYEVLYKQEFVNPINFFQRDLSNSEYERLIEIGNTQNKALD